MKATTNSESENLLDDLRRMPKPEIPRVVLPLISAADWQAREEESERETIHVIIGGDAN